MKNRTGLLILGIVLGLAWSANATPVVLLLPMNGLQGASGLGLSSAVGTAFLAIAPDIAAVNRDIAVSSIDFSLTAAHIQKTPANLTEPIVVDFEGRSNGSGLLTGPDLAGALGLPMNYYVNLHNRLMAAHRVGGQPETSIPDPSTLSLVAIGLACLGLSRRRGRSI